MYIGLGFDLITSAIAGGGAPPPGPPDPIPGITSAILRYDASNAASITLNTTPTPDRVAQWNDTEGVANNAVQATATQQPNYLPNEQNGLPGIRFKRAGDLDIALDTAAQAEIDNVIYGSSHLFFVIRFDEAVSNFPRFFDKAIRPAQDGSVSIGTNGTLGTPVNNFFMSMQFPDGLNRVIFQSAATFYVTNQAVIVDIAYNGASNLNIPTVRKDGTAVTINRTTTGTPAGPADDSTNTLEIGGLNGSNSSSEATMFEVVWFNEILSTSDQDDVFDYLKAKWGTP